jgi:glycosyltransferase involved in cell wall biosynthesis
MLKKYNRKIDIIIPAYNVEDEILFRCLSSIACQDVAKDLEVTIVDDASTVQNYQEVINNFLSILKINLLRYEENGGPGVARQYGLDHTQNGYITFIDADDTFNGAFALNYLRDTLESNPLYSVCIAGFDEVFTQEDEKGNKSVYFYPHDNDMVWMFGKMYKRNFIDKYNIRFHETSRANEDNGFNTTIRLLANDYE